MSLTNQKNDRIKKNVLNLLMVILAYENENITEIVNKYLSQDDILEEIAN